MGSKAPTALAADRVMLSPTIRFIRITHYINATVCPARFWIRFLKGDRRNEEKTLSKLGFPDDSQRAAFSADLQTTHAKPTD
jgi:hypothetical protein